MVNYTQEDYQEVKCLEKYENYHFLNKDFYEYALNYKNNDFNIIDIPISDFKNHSHCRLLLIIKGTSPNCFSTKEIKKDYIFL